MAELIVAFDLPNGREALALAARLPGLRWAKVGPVLYNREGPPLIKEFTQRGIRVFLDLKWHDIPNIVASAVGAARELGVSITTVHRFGERRRAIRPPRIGAWSRRWMEGITPLHAPGAVVLARIGDPADPGGGAGHALRCGGAGQGRVVGARRPGPRGPELNPDSADPRRRSVVRVGAATGHRVVTPLLSARRGAGARRDHDSRGGAGEGVCGAHPPLCRCWHDGIATRDVVSRVSVIGTQVAARGGTERAVIDCRTAPCGNVRPRLFFTAQPEYFHVFRSRLLKVRSSVRRICEHGYG